eukprot:SAG31_NODE_273_length_18667_cov_3.603619_3_plen_109_part_00
MNIAYLLLQRLYTLLWAFNIEWWSAWCYEAEENTTCCQSSEAACIIENSQTGEALPEATAEVPGQAIGENPDENINPIFDHFESRSVAIACFYTTVAGRSVHLNICCT